MNIHETPAVTKAEAAILCGVSLDTIKRHLRKGNFPNSAPRSGDPRGTILIPVGDLQAAGLNPAVEESEFAGQAIELVQTRDELKQAREQIDDLRAALAAMEIRVEERGQTIKTLERTLTVVSNREVA